MDQSINPLSAIGLSFYSSPFYRRVAQRWRPLSLAYLMFVLTLCWVPSLIQLHHQLKVGWHLLQTEVFNQIPTLRFENGELSTPESKPYLLSFGQKKQSLMVIIDTSGHITSLDGQPAQMLVTRHNIFIRQRTGETRIYDLSKSKAKPFVLNQAIFLRVLRPLKYWVLGMLYLLILIGSFLKRLIEAFFIALVGLILVSWMKAALDLGALLSLAIVAMTPAMVLETIVHLTGKSFHFISLLWMVLILGYFLFALNTASDRTQE